MAHKEISEVITLGASLGNAIGKSFEDGDWDWLSDPLNFIPVIKDVKPAIDNIDQVDDEFVNLTPEEFDELKAEFKEKFDIANDDVEQFVEDHYQLGLSFANVIVTHWLKPKDEVADLPAEEE